MSARRKAEAMGRKQLLERAAWWVVSFALCCGGAAAAEISNPDFNNLVRKLNDTDFGTRQAAQKELTAQALESLKGAGMGLSKEQLGALRVLATNRNKVTLPGEAAETEFDTIEPGVLAGSIVREWGGKFKEVTDMMRSIGYKESAVGGLTSTKVEFDQFFPIFVSFGANPSPPEQIRAIDKLADLQNDVSKAISAGNIGDLPGKLDALKNLSESDWDDTKFAESHAQFKQKVNAAISKAQAVIDKIREKSDNADPGPPQKLPVPPGSTGALDPARSFNISVTNTVSGGEMDIFSPAPLGQNLRWVEGYAFVGQFYEVTASESLEFSGPITIEITFGPDPLVGYPLLARTDPGEVLLARFANRQLEILDNLQVELQPDRYVVRGQYTPPSGGSGFDQLGTFVVLQTVPEPGSLMLLAMAGGWLFGRGRRQGWFAGRM